MSDQRATISERGHGPDLPHHRGGGGRSGVFDRLAGVRSWRGTDRAAARRYPGVVAGRTDCRRRRARHPVLPGVAGVSDVGGGLGAAADRDRARRATRPGGRARGPAVKPAPGADGRMRCPWAISAPDYCVYHDDEWAVPLHGEAALFERLSLEAFQSGLSWLTILRKRDAFRRAFAGFHPVTGAAFTVADVIRLLADAAIVRNRAKIEATVHNARAVIELGEDLDALLWSF